MHTVGTTATVRQVLHLPGGNLRVIVEGLKRAKVHQIDKKDGILYAQIEEGRYCFQALFDGNGT